MGEILTYIGIALAIYLTYKSVRSQKSEDLLIWLSVVFILIAIAVKLRTGPNPPINRADPSAAVNTQ
ncbi:TPA: hypothetical protein DF272_06855 [Candidatus Falkowbacteria bacterium]|nr:hypothetical protein [Candidatus Falkowbacteria bacterium]